MNLLGRDISPAKVQAYLVDQLRSRGLTNPEREPLERPQVEPRIDPLSFTLEAMSENVDATQGLPVETHRDGLAGLLVTNAKGLFRKTCQVFINEALGRQRNFNGHVRDGYAQLSAEVMRLRTRVQELEGELEKARPARKVVRSRKPTAKTKQKVRK